MSGVVHTRVKVHRIDSEMSRLVEDGIPGWLQHCQKACVRKVATMEGRLV